MTARVITFAVDCKHCDGDAVFELTDVSQPDDGTVRVDVSSLSQTRFTCGVCGCQFGFGDLSDELHSFTSYDDCPLPDEEDDDYDLDDDFDGDLAYEGGGYGG